MVILRKKSRVGCGKDIWETGQKTITINTRKKDKSQGEVFTAKSEEWKNFGNKMKNISKGNQ